MPTTDTPIRLTRSLAEQILDLLTVYDLLRTGSDEVRAELARPLLICPTEPRDAAVFLDAVGFTAGHLHAHLDQLRRASSRHDETRS